MKIVLLTAGGGQSSAKTAIQIIRYRPDEVLAIVDPAQAGKNSSQLFGVGKVPVIRSLSEAPEADTLMIGIAPAGGRIPAEMRAVILQALSRGMTVISGLHEFLSQDPEFERAAHEHGGRLIDVRQNTERDVAHRRGLREGCLRIHTVGQDCNVGKMLVSLELARALEKAGPRTKFVATGQTGIMIEGDGCPIDAVVADFVNGAAEKLVLKNQDHDILMIEGQGSIVHPRYSAVTLGLLHGCAPDGLILCYELGRQHVAGMAHIPLTPLPKLAELYEAMANVIHPCRVIGVAINSFRSTAAQADQERERVRAELGLPACDVLRHGPEDLVSAVLQLKQKLGK
jgi:uncharacterized NAD-dependent epimerase/dehydratase family protein